MSLESLKEIDDLDTRREMVYLLHKLDPPQRVYFLSWCIVQVNNGIKLRHNPPWVLVKISNTTGTADETFFDIAMLIAQFGLSVQFVLSELERVASAVTTGQSIESCTTDQ